MELEKLKYFNIYEFLVLFDTGLGIITQNFDSNNELGWYLWISNVFPNKFFFCVVWIFFSLNLLISTSEM